VEGKARVEGHGLLSLSPPFGAGRQTGKWLTSMAAHYKNPQWQQPNTPNKEIRKIAPKKFVTRTKNKATQGKPNHTHATHHPPEKGKTNRTPTPGARGTLPPGFLLLLSHHSRRCHRPFLARHRCFGWYKLRIIRSLRICGQDMATGCSALSVRLSPRRSK